MTTRSEFLTAGVAAAAIPNVAAASPAPQTSPAGSPAPNAEPSLPPLHFDVSAFDSVLNVAALHKHLFAAAKLNGGLILDNARSVLEAYRSLGVSYKDVQPALVFYHFTTCLGFNDVVWNEYFIPLQPKKGAAPVEFATDFASIYDGKARGNPCLHKTGKSGDTSIEALVADSDARFFVCNNATSYIAGFTAKQLKLKPLDVYTKMLANLVPNAMMVPAGVWGIHAVQERHYTYQQATL